MGNAQKKLGIRRGKDHKSGHTKQAKVPEEKHIQALLSKGPIEKFYEVNPNAVLGRGHYAIVNLGMSKQTKQHVAVKRIQISKSRIEALQREVQVLRKVGSHPNIVCLFDIFVTNTELQLVMELLRGGELFDRMVERGPYSERDASYHIRKIGLALQFLHQNGIVHRDLKPENLILTDKTDNAELKIADFGLSRIVDDVASSTMQTICGTWAYCAPEVKTSIRYNSNNQSIAQYTAAVDCWSLGVILFVILGAYHPFDPDGDATDVKLWSSICSGVFNFDDPAWQSISSLAKDLITRLIVVDPIKRYTIEQVLVHPWITNLENVQTRPITPSIDRSLGTFVGRNKAKTPRPVLGINYMHEESDIALDSSTVYATTSNQITAQPPEQPPQPRQLEEPQQVPQQNFQPEVGLYNQQNPGLTLDTGVPKFQATEKMEVCTPSAKK